VTPDFTSELVQFAEQKRLGGRHRDAGPGIAPARRTAFDFAEHDRRVVESARRLLSWAEVEHDLPAERLAGCVDLVLKAKLLVEELRALAVQARDAR
jgi:hypothetical protein